MASRRFEHGPYNDWIEKDGFGQFRLIGPEERFIVHPSTGVCTGTFVNTVGGTVTIEEDAFLGNNVSLLTGSHDIRKFGQERMHGTSSKRADIIIRRGAWVANSCTIIGPCDIGENAVVTAGTTVRGVVPPGAVIAPQHWRILTTLEVPVIEDEILLDPKMNVREEDATALGGRDVSDFDRTWLGPVEMKPRVYRSQLEKDTWYSVVVNDEYKLPGFAPTDVVIDIGGHIGSVSWLAHARGSRAVWCFEPNAWHYEALVENVAGLEGVHPQHMAIVRGDAGRASAYNYAADTWTVMRGHGTEVPSISLDEILAQTGPVRLIKTDCEGSEFPILYTCKRLDLVQMIVGEYHPMRNPLDYGAELADLPPCTMPALAEFLREQGFTVTYDADNPNEPETSLGRFAAHR